MSKHQKSRLDFVPDTCVVCGKGFSEGQFRCARDLTRRDTDKMHPNCVWKVVDRLDAVRKLVEEEKWNADFRQVLVDALGRTS